MRIASKSILALGLSLAFVQSCRTTGRSKTSDAQVTTKPSDLSDAYCQAQAQRAANQLASSEGPNGYGIFTATVHNVPGYMKYLKQANEVLARHKGRAVMWGPNIMNLLEGQAFGYYFMVLEFPSMQSFDGFYCSPDYRPHVIKERMDATKVILSVAKEGDASSRGVDSSSASDNVKGFILFNDIVKDQKAYDRYLEAATELAKASGGQRLVSGPVHTMIEGKAEDKPDNLTLFSFPSMDKLKEWYESPAYKELKKARLSASEVKFVVAKKGLTPP